MEPLTDVGRRKLLASMTSQVDHDVREAFGPPLSGLEAGSAIALGVVSLLIAGVMPVLLAALADERRLSAAGIGLSATLEALTLAAACAFAGAAVKPMRLRLIGASAAIALAVVDGVTAFASGAGVLAVRALAGVPEGFLLWICVSMIARTATPERWAGVLLTAVTLSQFAIATTVTAAVLPPFHAAGGFFFVGAISLAMAPVAFLGATSYAPLPKRAGGSFPFPARGWIALAVSLLFNAAVGAVGIYLVAIAERDGLSATVGGASNSVSLAFQVAGGAAAVAVAGRARYFSVFVGSGAGLLTAWSVFAATPPVWFFIAAAALFGFSLLFIGPFFVPMTIEADPSRATAVQLGPAQVLGGALGPLLASLTVAASGVHAVLALGAALVALALALSAYLHFGGRHAGA
jgi:hypothetical protein